MQSPNLDALQVEQIRHGPLWNFSYLLWCLRSCEAVVIDPGRELAPLLSRVDSLGVRVVAAVVTHFHTDHTAGLAPLIEATAAQVVVHHADAAGLSAHYHGPMRESEHSTRLGLGEHALHLWHAPGHTAGSQWLVTDDAVFTGDSLMVGCVGRTGSEPEAGAWMWQTVQQARTLPAELVLYPGHDYGPTRWSTLAQERERNPGLRAASLPDLLACIDP